MSMLIFSVLLFLFAGTRGASDNVRKPACVGLVEIIACPMNMAPVCGTDGNTYANECSLCAESVKTKTDIFIAKDGSC